MRQPLVKLFPHGEYGNGICRQISAVGEHAADDVPHNPAEGLRIGKGGLFPTANGLRCIKPTMIITARHASLDIAPSTRLNRCSQFWPEDRFSQSTSQIVCSRTQ